MMSILPEEDSCSPVKMKQTLMSDRSVKEDTRPFLSFSRENLSILHTDLEQGFNRSRLRPNRNTILSVTAFVIALLCLGLESWKLYYSLTNSHEIAQLKRDVDSLKHRFLEQNLINELKAFEEQLYAEDSNENHDPDETDINNADYDSNYDDDGSTSHDYSGDYHTPLTYGNIPSDLPEITSTPISISTSPNPDFDKTSTELLTALHKVKAKRGQEYRKNVRENHKSVEREHLNEEISDNDSTKHKRDVLARPVGLQKKEESTKLKRSVDDTANDTAHLTSNNYHGGNRQTRKTIVSRTRSYDDSKMDGNTAINSTQAIISSERHPPKKYYGSHFEEYPSTQDGQLSDETGQPNRRTGEEAEYVDGEINWWNDRRDITGNRTEIHRPVQNFEVVSRQFHRGLTRRHLRASRQVYAIHYGADSTLFSAEDEHTGNGRARHSSSIFKAWRPSEWAADLGMNRHFTLAADGKLTVHESGLYLVYAQIHYLDEHDENGFHLLANGRPIMQCMVYSPGIGHKSRSCFSSQVAVFHSGDNLILKDVGSARYTLFQHDKSFFGLVKLGELRQQRHQPQQSMSSHQ